MCTPKVNKQAPAASTTPTMQAADQLELITDGLQDNAIGRAALRTSGGARKPASAQAAAEGAPAATTGVAPATTDAETALDLGTARGRAPGSRQPFFVATP